MVHNSIEQGMMSVISEVWYILIKGLQLSYEEAASICEKWNQSQELFNTFLIYIAVVIDKTKDSKGRYVFGRVKDKLFQDVDNTEGTGTWSCEEAVRLHVPAATILSAHLFRCASADLDKRVANEKASEYCVQPTEMNVNPREDFIEDRRQPTNLLLLFAMIRSGATNYPQGGFGARLKHQLSGATQGLGRWFNHPSRRHHGSFWASVCSI
ncbi:hypothetical protein FNYG_15197 [Fusarium nygamai]|uniref:phosphogluconate dehydrogenase (NADP(+)-dependent, decarboxylating) n=1 Tax=Gibberella nygamai TaxID=42673 RepID=A0A2K0UIW4_GIBNY|nr:hypothetical protein FNYG_15197 [Fusarium nygamai]